MSTLTHRRSSTPRTIAFALAAIVALLALPACGGGGGGGSAAATPAVLTGVFSAGTPVAGLAYASASHSGTTGPDGTFLYAPGETIRFSVGGAQLGEGVPAAAAMSPLDLVPGSILPTTEAEVRAFLLLVRNENRTGPTYTMVNILSLLLSLDRDKDTTNGIQIDPAMAGIIPALEFAMALERFPSVAQPYLYAGYDVQAVSHARFIPWHAALDFFAAARGVRPEVFVTSRYVRDTDADGVPNVATIFELDADGRLLAEGHDHDADGRIDNRTSFDVDANANATRVARDTQNDGTVDQIVEIAFDAHGLEVLRTLDADADGSPESSTSTQRGAVGGPIRTETDLDGDGTPDRVETASYDAQGRLVELVYDGDADGTADRRETRTYNGPSTTIAIDDDGDGTFDRTQTLVHDAAGRVLSIRRVDAQGTVDLHQAWVYDDVGRIVREEDLRTGGLTVHEFVNGRATLTRHDNDGDGTWDWISTSEYDAHGNPTRNLDDMDADGTWDRIATREYNATGHLIRYAIDYDADGIDELAYYYERDALGNLLVLSRDDGADGTTDAIDTYEYRQATFTNWDLFRRLAD